MSILTFWESIVANNISTFFGQEFIEENSRTSYYHFIEDYISKHVPSWDSPPATDIIANNFFKTLKKLNNKQFSFLLCTSGYIPEYYPHDSSQETLYTKLIEVLVCEWALRIGFTESYIQKQKGSKEDVTLVRNGMFVVCDAKSYRLGRSQAAPNVKDTIKKSDFQKWLSEYPEESRLGGLITFPILHAWKKSSDAYLYCTDKHDPITLLFYHQLAFILLNSQASEKFFTIFSNYNRLFPSPSKDQSRYFRTVNDYLFGEAPSWHNFDLLSDKLHQERVKKTIKRCEEHLKISLSDITKIAKSIPIEDLMSEYISTRYEGDNKEVIRQIENIKKFRKN